MTPWDPYDAPDFTLAEIIRAVPAAVVVVLLVGALIALTILVGSSMGSV